MRGTWAAVSARLMAAGAIALVGVSPALAAPWYDDATYTCDDPLNIRPIMTSGPWLQRKLPLDFVNPAQGRVVARIDDRQLAALAAGASWETISLDDQKATSLRGIIAGAADQYDVSVLSAVGQDFASDYLLAAVGKTFSGTLAFSGFRAFVGGLMGARVAQYRSIAPLIARGGRITHDVRLVTRNGRAALSSAYVYDVEVGQEGRRVVLSACAYPANVLTRHFITQVGVNDLELRKDGALWRIYRKGFATEQVPGRHLIETGMDGEWVYATLHDPGGFWHNERNRVSRIGGAWERFDAAENRWMNLYSKVASTPDP